MSNQLQITGDLKVKSLTGALTATAGVVTSVPLGAANGVATLGGDGKVPAGQLPTMGSSYKGTWNAATNTPTITNGVGTAGDYYLVSTGGTFNGDVYVAGNTIIYSGTVWQKAGGGSGTVTSVGLAAPAAFSVSGSPVTGAGTLTLAGAGTTNDYIKGDGTLGVFGSSAISAVSGTYLALSGGIMTGQIVLKEGTTISDYTKGLRFPNDPYGGSGDTSGLRLYAETTTGAEAQVLELYITNDGAGVGQDRINFQAPSNDLVTINGNKIWNAGNLTPQTQLNGTGFVKATGTTISYDNSTYLTTSSASSTYLPLAGGTLTGALVGTSATFSNILTSSSADQSTSRIVISNTGTGGQSINLVAGNPNTDNTGFSIAYGNTNFLRFISSGAASFLNSVDINGILTVNSGASATTTSFTNNGDFISNWIGNSTTQLFSIRNVSTTGVYLNTQNSTPLILGVSSGTTGGTIVNHLSIASTGAATFSGNVGISGILNVRSSSVTPSIWSGLFGGAITILGDNGTANRWIDISIVDSTGAISSQGLRVVNGGNVLINSTTDLGAGYKLQVNGSISMAYANFFNFKGSSGAGDVLVDNSGSTLRVTGAVQLSNAVTFNSTALVQGLLTNYNVYNTQTSSYTLVLSDASKIIEMNVGSANTVTIPTNATVAFPIGTEITVMQYGAGITSIAVASGVTIVSKDNATIIGNRYTGVTILKRGTNEWYLIGNIVV